MVDFMNLVLIIVFNYNYIFHELDSS